MFTAQARPSPKPEVSASSSLRRPALGGTGSNGRVSGRVEIPGYRSRVNRKNQAVRAVISGGDNKTVETTKVVEDNNGSLMTSSTTNGGIEVRAVITIRKKMKEKITERFEDQWESLINGLGQGILIQLISEEIDPD